PAGVYRLNCSQQTMQPSSVILSIQIRSALVGVRPFTGNISPTKDWRRSRGKSLPAHYPNAWTPSQSRRRSPRQQDKGSFSYDLAQRRHLVPQHSRSHVFRALVVLAMRFTGHWTAMLKQWAIDVQERLVTVDVDLANVITVL